MRQGFNRILIKSYNYIVIESHQKNNINQTVWQLSITSITEYYYRVFDFNKSWKSLWKICGLAQSVLFHDRKCMYLCIYIIYKS